MYQLHLGQLDCPTPPGSRCARLVNPSGLRCSRTWRWQAHADFSATTCYSLCFGPSFPIREHATRCDKQCTSFATHSVLTSSRLAAPTPSVWMSAALVRCREFETNLDPGARRCRCPLQASCFPGWVSVDAAIRAVARETLVCGLRRVELRWPNRATRARRRRGAAVDARRAVTLLGDEGAVRQLIVLLDRWRRPGAIRFFDDFANHLRRDRCEPSSRRVHCWTRSATARRRACQA